MRGQGNTCPLMGKGQMKIFLTGGTGSLGQAILRRAAQQEKDEGFSPEFTIYSRDEFKQGELRKLYPQYTFILGDIRNEEWLRVVMRGHDAVIHTAAYKHVPQAEFNVAEAVEINVIGSRNIARMAVELGVKRVVGISTDKSCAPINTYVMTKALMEKLFAHACLWGETQFNCVRYGNVLGSRGSVLPLFQEQYKATGKVTVTDPTMTRFWLTLDEGVDLVLRGLQEENPGVVIVPKAVACTMETMAKAIAEDCQMVIIGIRAGERINERLIHVGEAIYARDCGDVFKVWPAYSGAFGNLPADFEYTSDKAKQLTVEEMRAMIAKVQATIGG